MKQALRFLALSCTNPTKVVPVSSLHPDSGKRVPVPVRVVFLLKSNLAALRLDCHRHPVAVVGKEFGY